MATAVISDLHLGSRAALLGDGDLRRTLLAELAGVEQVVLLGDVVELRERPLAAALEAALPFFEELGETLGKGRVVVVPGNHDHQLAGAWLERRRLANRSEELEAEQLSKPGSSRPLAALARRLGDAELTLAYPGIWIRPDVYATHGHYVDLHLTVPTFETVAAAATRRLIAGRADRVLSADDYEAALAPTYAFAYELAQAAPAKGPVVNPRASARIWERLNGSAGRAQALVVGAAVAGAVAALNRLGLGPFSADLSAESLRRAGLRGMAEVVERLGIEAGHVIFGHTHRKGPLPRDDDDPDWRPGGKRLLNTGSWIYEPAFVGGGGPTNPYWPGALALVPEHGPPRLRELLSGLTEADLAAASGRA